MRFIYRYMYAGYMEKLFLEGIEAEEWGLRLRLIDWLINS